MAILNIPIVKAKGEFVTVDTDNPDQLPSDVYAEALALGLKVLVNRGTSKITKSTYPNADELKQAAVAKAQEQMELIATSKIKFSGKSSKAKKASGAVMTEARRLARNLVKDAIKREGKKVSHFKASDITKLANMWLDDEAIGPDLIKQAEANLAERATPAGIDLKALLHEDPTLVAKAKADAEAKRNKGGMSAKQAGMTKKHKPSAQATAH